MTAIELLSLQAASEAFSTDTIPDNWYSMSEAEQDAWLDDHKASAYDYTPTDNFYTLISDHSGTIEMAMDKLIKIIESKLISAAIADTLPLDMNELDIKSLIIN